MSSLEATEKQKIFEAVSHIAEDIYAIESF